VRTLGEIRAANADRGAPRATMTNVAS